MAPKGHLHLEVGIFNMLKYECRRLGLWVADNVEQLDNVDATTEVLQDLDFALNLLLLDRLPCREIPAKDMVRQLNASCDPRDSQQLHTSQTSNCHQVLHLENFDDALRPIRHVAALEYLAVLSAAQFAHNLVIFQVPVGHFTQ